MERNLSKLPSSKGEWLKVPQVEIGFRDFQEFLPGQMLFSVLVNYINDGIEFTFTRFVDDTEEDRQMWYKKELSQQGLCGLLQRNTSPAHLKQSNH